LERDASKTTDIHLEEWTHIRGRKMFGMSEREISKFLASKALRDAKVVRCDGWAFPEIMPQSEATPHEEVKDD
jgi:hypothetical protein